MLRFRRMEERRYVAAGALGKRGRGWALPLRDCGSGRILDQSDRMAEPLSGAAAILIMLQAVGA